MKALRLVIGILSIVLFFVVIFQSCAAGVVEAFGDEKDSTASTAGVLFSFLILTGGITAICTRKSFVGGIVCTIIYALAGLIGLVGHGMYTDLIIWSSGSCICALVFLITSVIMKIKTKNNAA